MSTGSPSETPRCPACGELAGSGWACAVCGAVAEPADHPEFPEGGEACTCGMHGLIEHPTDPPMDCGICGSTQDACDDTTKQGWCCDGCYHLLGASHDDGFRDWLARRDEKRDREAVARLPRLLSVPDEESMYGLLAALNYGSSPELPCSAPGGVSFLATLTEPDADYVNYIWSDESGHSRCVVGCENCGTEESAREDWKPRYPVTAILSQMPDLERAAEDEIEEAQWLRAALAESEAGA